MKFTIDRSKWRCGGSMEAAGKQENLHGEGDTELLNPLDYQCCLGFVAEQCGVPKERFVGIGLPQGLRGDPQAVDKLLGILLVNTMDEETSEEEIVDSKLANDAVEINDNNDLTDAERESQLTKLFADAGHEITFIGSYHVPVLEFWKELV